LEKRAEQVLPGSKRNEGRVRGQGGGEGRQMAKQCMHMSINKQKKEIGSSALMNTLHILFFSEVLLLLEVELLQLIDPKSLTLSKNKTN
jgi:hypothetical protein